MNKERLKKLIYDLELTTGDLERSLKLLKKYKEDDEFKLEFSNSLKYKYLSLFILYEDFISMLLKEYGLYEIGISINDAIIKLFNKGYLNECESEFLNSARIIRNKIGHRYKQPSIEAIIEFLEENNNVMLELKKLMNSYIK